MFSGKIRSQPVSKVSNGWDAHSHSHPDRADVTGGLEHRVSNVGCVPGKSSHPPKTLQGRCCSSHFPDEKIELQRRNLPKVTLPGSSRTRIQICALPGRKFLITGDLPTWRLEDNFVRMAFPLNLLVNDATLQLYFQYAFLN